MLQGRQHSKTPWKADSGLASADARLGKHLGESNEFSTLEKTSFLLILIFNFFYRELIDQWGYNGALPQDKFCYCVLRFVPMPRTPSSELYYKGTEAIKITAVHSTSTQLTDDSNLGRIQDTMAAIQEIAISRA